jgi:hypothetical protein
MKTVIYDTLKSLVDQAPEQHAQIRQSLYDQLDLSFGKQIELFTNVLAPASSGKLENSQDFDNAVETALKVLETPEH